MQLVIINPFSVGFFFFRADAPPASGFVSDITKQTNCLFLVNDNAKCPPGVVLTFLLQKECQKEHCGREMRKRTDTSVMLKGLGRKVEP